MTQLSHVESKLPENTGSYRKRRDGESSHEECGRRTRPLTRYGLNSKPRDQPSNTPNAKSLPPGARDETQVQYVEDFSAAVKSFLAFDPSHSNLADRLASVVADHATPVGSGTVARTKRIPVKQRAEAAVIAWMRHQTTAYDSLSIPRIKGKRREVRRMLAQRSQELLECYRHAEPVSDECPLKKALDQLAV